MIIRLFSWPAAGSPFACRHQSPSNCPQWPLAWPSGIHSPPRTVPASADVHPICRHSQICVPVVRWEIKRARGDIKLSMRTIWCEKPRGVSGRRRSSLTCLRCRGTSRTECQHNFISGGKSHFMATRPVSGPVPSGSGNIVGVADIGPIGDPDAKHE